MTAGYRTEAAPVRRPPAPVYRTEVVTDERAFAGLAPAWARLHARSPSATPFQSHAWLHSWWLSYGSPGGLRLILVRAHDAGGASVSDGSGALGGSGGELVAAAPLMRVHRPLPALVPLGGPISDYADVLLDDEHGEAAVAALTEGLAQAARTALIDFREARPGAAVERVYDRWTGPRRRVDDSVCLELPALPMDGLIDRLPSAKARQRFRAKLRKLQALGVERRVVPPGEAERALGRMLELHRLQWEGRGVTPEHLRPRFRDHLVRSAGPMVLSGDAVVTEFRLDGEVVAVDLTLLSRRLAGGYLYGAHPRLRERRADVAVMLLEACTGHVRPGGPGTLSLLRGNEPYKHHWRPEPVVNRRLLLARRRTAPLLRAALYGAGLRRLGGELLRRRKERDGDRSS